MTRIAHWFRDLPIEHKLSTITNCVVLAALLPFAGITLAYEYLTVRRAKVQEVQIQANIIRDNTAAALAFRDASSAREVLDTLRASPGIVQAVLTLPDGSVLAHYVREPAAHDRAAPALRHVEQALVTGTAIQVERQVELKGQVVGWLLLESNLDALHERINLYALFITLITLAALGLAHGLVRRLIGSITRPLSRLVKLTHDVARQGDYTLRETVDSRDEIGDLSHAFNTMLSHIHDRDVRLHQLAYRDNVTGLTNRHFFKERAEEAISRAQSTGSRCGLMFIDLDRFKAVNDTLGHDIGDELLQVVALRLSALLRSSDVICRIGGDEFAVILENIHDLAFVSSLAEKMVVAATETVLLRGHSIGVGASIGISVCPDHATTMSDLLRCADQAMYQAKAQGRGQYCVYGGPAVPAGANMVAH
ncbi:MAG TPA: diguanylate cyclase [Burkholderiaceae bacterium]|nr:diguanylate cyclase [Burkholderiaceae bacterium]